VLRPARAVSFALILALSGTAACAAPRELVVSPDAQASDAVWVALSRGDLETADHAASALADADLAARARLDLVAASEGRAAALVRAIDDGSWLAARYRASSVRASDELRRAASAGQTGAAFAIERARRAERASETLERARAAQSDATAAAEARAIEVETLLVGGRFVEAAERLPDPPPTARLALLQRHLDAACGRPAAVLEGVCADLAAGWAVPNSLALLEDALRSQPSLALEARARAALDGAELAGAPMLRARERLLAILDVRAGDLSSAAARLAAFDPREPEEDEALRRWSRRVDPGAADTLEERLDADAARLTGRDLLVKRLGDEWDLEARLSYQDALEGRGVGLDTFLERLDDAAQPLPDAPLLAPLPRQDFGVFGAMLDTTPLRTALPDAVLLGGQAALMPPELTWFDKVGCEEVELPEGLGHYEQCTVRRTRVAGRLASQGVNIAGAGVGRLVWLDLDELEREERGSRTVTSPGLEALPAADRRERLALDEPLDVAERLTQASRADAGPAYEARLLETIALHEGQHIIDFQEFVAKGTVGQAWSLLTAGLLPGAVRAEIERRAHLRALREATDPRIALAEAIARLPVEGEALQEEHAVAYAALVGELVTLLDRPALPDGRPPESLGIDRGRVLLQQLDRLPPETLRALALELPD